MTRYAIAGLAALSLVLFAWFQMARADRLAESLDKAEARIEGYEQAAAVHRAHIQRLQQIAEQASALDREFQEQEGADALLGDYLRSGAIRVWP